MEEVIKKYNIRKDKSGLYRLNDIVKNMIKSKNPNSYMDRIKNKKRNKKSKNFYIDESQFLAILNKSRSKICKDALKILSPPEEIEPSELSKPSEAITTIDIDNNNFLFEGRKITVIHVNDEVWFKGKDIAKILEYQNTEQSLKQNIDDEDRIRFTDFDTYFQNGYPNTVKKQKSNTIFINESGLYSLIMRSKMKAAKSFQRWVTKEVLPSIRKTGTFDINQTVTPQIVYDLNDYVNKSCFYIINIRDNIYKYGISDNMARRGLEHINNFDSPKIIKIYELDNYSICRNIENKRNLLIKQLNINCFYDKDSDESVDDYKKNVNKECFITNNKYTISNILEYIDKYIEDYNNNNIYVELDMEKEKTKQSKEVTKQLQIKLEIKKLNIQELKIKSNMIKLNSISYNESDESDDNSELITIESSDDELNNIDYSDDEISKKKCIDCDIEIFKTSTRCNSCRNIKKFKENKNSRPSYKQLMKDLKNNTYVKVGEKYRVSDNAVRKWIKTYKKYNDI